MGSRAGDRLAPRILPSLLACLAWAGVPLPAAAQEEDTPSWLEDRGPGIATSLFGTYVEAGELLVYPFYEFTRTSAFEYQPRELGGTGSADYLGKTVEHEALLFLSYGISDRVMVELEGALWAKTTFDKAPDDPSELPRRIEESGLGDVEGQVRWRWREETADRPELFSFVEIVFPLQKDEMLIGTQDWEGAFGFGAIRGFDWGTLDGRLTLAWDSHDSRVELGEYALEYLKRVSKSWRLVAALEGESEDVALIGEAQWLLGDRAMVKLNCGFGVTEKAPDIAPEVGLLLRF